MNKFEESLGKLDLKGIILMQGLLAQQALKLLYEQENNNTKPILVPDKKLIL